MYNSGQPAVTKYVSPMQYKTPFVSVTTAAAAAAAMNAFSCGQWDAYKLRLRILTINVAINR